MLRQKMFKGLLLAVAYLFLSMPVTAKAALIDLTVNGGWHEFAFPEAGSPWADEFSFSLLTPGTLTVTDAHVAGDRFEVFSNGMSLGLTSEPLSQYDFTDQYDLAASDPRWSTGIWSLAAGKYLISGLTTLSPYGSGSAALRVDTAPVPVPAAAWLLGSALIGGLGLRRFRKN